MSPERIAQQPRKKSIRFYSLIRVVSTTVTVCGLEVKKGLFQHSGFLGSIKLNKKSVKKAALSNSLPKALRRKSKREHTRQGEIYNTLLAWWQEGLGCFLRCWR